MDFSGTELDGIPYPFGRCEHFRTPAVNETLNPLLGAVDVVLGFGRLARCYGEIFANSSRYNKLGNVFLQLGTKFVDDIHFAKNFIDASEIYTCLIMAIIWTLTRCIMTKFVFKPWARFIGFRENEIEKIGESCWKTTAFFTLWSVATYVTFFRGYNYFSEPLTMFADWSLEKPPNDLRFDYALEFSFYIHSVYASFFMDFWRKDSVAMLLHHFVAMILIAFSYPTRCLKIGVLIFFLNDMGDVILEFGKVCIYLRGSKCFCRKFFGFLADFCGVLFVVTWVINRLWFHLTKVWRSACLGFWISHRLQPMPLLLIIDLLLGALFLLYLYWSWFIALFAIRNIFRKQTSSVGDPREDEEKKRE